MSEHDADVDPQQNTGEAWFDETWTKVHPLSPLVRGWLTIVAIPVAFFGYNWQMWQDLWEVYQSGELIENLQQNPLPYLIGAGAFLLLAVVIFVGFTLSWWFTRYKITDEHVMVKSGIFVRQHRQARIDRMQAVDLRQPLLARFTKLAELKFEVAEGDGTAATLAFLRKSEAEQLRGEIMDRAAGRVPRTGAESAEPAGPADESHDPGSHDLDSDDPESGGHTNAAPQQGVQDRQIVRVPLGRLIGSVLAGVGTVVLLIIGFILLLVVGGIALGFAMFGDTTLREAFGEINLPLFIPLIIGAFVTYYGQLSSGFRFTATMTEMGLRLKYGLLETTNQTVPPGRVQAIQIQQPLMWRPFGWHKIVVTVAGYGLTDRTTLLPVGTRDEVMRMAAEMFPDLKIDNPEQMFVEGLFGTGTEHGFTQVPPRAKIFDPVVRRRRGFFTTPSALMIRDGRLARSLTMVPHERIQSASLQQGPWARARDVATMLIHIPSGPITARVHNQDLEQARELFEQESSYAAVARRMSDRDLWMQPDELREFEKMVQTMAAERGAADEPSAGEEESADEPWAARKVGGA
ncbi:PH domain-containing protein [Garicola koreensis]|uniref:PH domain-containing protein n=1 Tax=Garicola koreensis TaxID=1262554 RepID=UPI0031E9B91C